MRNSTIDLLKALASQLIVLHHLLLYTPMSPVLQQAWPTLLGWVADEGRYMVQIFLVIGGYLATQSLFGMLQNKRAVALWPLFKKRYLRLAKPFWVAIAVAVLLNWLASRIAVHGEVAQSPTPTQVLAHVFLLHDIVEVEALSAGVWYVAIDLQLFFLLMLFGWLGQKLAWPNGLQAKHAMLMLATATTVASLWWYNRHAGHDEWAWYFFGAYGMGVLAHWAQRENKLLLGSLGVVSLLTIALWIEWRERLLLTGAVALLLMHSERIEHMVAHLTKGPIRWLGDISYSVFLIHYGLAVLASSMVIALGLNSFVPMLLAFLLTWGVSVAAGWLLYWGVENRL
ncbi:acyltransferase family protein [Limnobacter sp.]|uniref:acyltransferase family protein n=1 Tax=Limnobacter sp. TaxID=2003368 RepID=UPI0035134E06